MGNILAREKQFSRKGVDEDEETMQEYIIR